MASTTSSSAPGGRAGASSAEWMHWQFGALVPPAYEAGGHGEYASCRTECLFEVDSGALLHVRVRFQQLVTRSPGEASDQPWDEAVPRQVDAVVPVPRLFGAGWCTSFTVAGSSGDPGHREELRGELRLRAEPVPGPYGLLRLRVEVANTSPWVPQAPGRDAAMRCSLVGSHTLLALTLGRFHSLLDPPEFARAGTEACQNLRTWPVLVGDPGQRNRMLSAPIIRYEHPRRAPTPAQAGSPDQALAGSGRPCSGQTRVRVAAEGS